jgi:hypothetical protein
MSMPAVDTEPTKRQVAKHSLLDSTGVMVEEMEQATGIRYQDIVTGKTFDYQLKQGDALRMLALFGARTLATNEASAARQKDADGNEQLAAITERFALIDTGVWVDRTREGGPRIDQAVLSQAVFNVMAASGKVQEVDRDAKIAKLLENWAADPKKVTLAHSVPAVRDEYAKLAGKTARTVDDLAAMLG